MHVLKFLFILFAINVFAQDQLDYNKVQINKGLKHSLNSGYIFLDEFVVGDGVTDDADAINVALDSCRSQNKTLVLSPKNYLTTKQLIFTDVHIYGNGGTILSDIPASSTRYVLGSIGTVGTAYSLSEIAKRGDQFIKITDAEFLASIFPGDLVNVSSEKYYGAEVEGAFQGEIHEVRKVHEWGLSFNDYLFDTYKTSDAAKVKKIIYSTGSVRDLSITNVRTDSTERIIGIYFKYAKEPKVEGVSIRNTFIKGIEFNDCYTPQASNFNIANTIRDGYGYGINLSQATTYGVISDGVIFGARHSISLGGGANGVVWEARISNVVGTIGSFTGGTVFDAHESVGSVRFYNCKAINGLMTNNYDVPLFDDEGTYSIGDLVYDSDGYIYRSLIDTNTDALSVTESWKQVSGNVNSGFNIRGNDVQIINCVSENSVYGIVGSGATAVKNVEIKNFRSKNCDYAIIINSSVIDNVVIDGLEAMSDKVISSGTVNITGTIGSTRYNNMTMYDPTNGWRAIE